MTEPTECPVCGDFAPPAVSNWILRCTRCGFERTEIAVRINDESLPIDESTREASLSPLRDRNFDDILQRLKQHAPAGARLLDVGCSHGWFLRKAIQAGYDAVGVEPDLGILDHMSASARDLPIRVGFFPEAVKDEPPFDVITFNDVFEHIPDVSALTANVQKFLKPNGLLVLNLPVTDGLYYRMARIMAQLGVKSPLERMWQLPFPSPHVSYFSHHTLDLLSERHGWTTLEAFDLQTATLSGMWERIAISGRGPLYNVTTFAGSCGLLALSGFFPSDAHCRIVRKQA